MVPAPSSPSPEGKEGRGYNPERKYVSMKFTPMYSFLTTTWPCAWQPKELLTTHQ
jgi:hypothetical protein